MMCMSTDELDDLEGRVSDLEVRIDDLVPARELESAKETIEHLEEALNAALGRIDDLERRADRNDEDMGEISHTFRFLSEDDLPSVVSDLSGLSLRLDS